MLSQLLLAMAAFEEPQAAVLPRGIVDGDPDRAGRQGADGPVLAVLVPRGLPAWTKSGWSDSLKDAWHHRLLSGAMAPLLRAKLGVVRRAMRRRDGGAF